MWQPIETVPRDGTPVLVWLPIKQCGSHVQAALFRPNISTIGGLFSFDTSSKPTHWMPQQAAPE